MATRHNPLPQLPTFNVPMKVVTNDGEILIVSLGHYTSKTEKIIFFKNRAGTLISSYYISTFNLAKDGDGLILSDPCDPDCIIDDEEVIKCKNFIRNHS